MHSSVFIAFDEFIIALTDGSAGDAALVAVVGIVPEERASCDGLSLEGGSEV